VVLNFPKRWTMTRRRIVAHIEMMRVQRDRVEGERRPV
jgi:hypothetical protein